MKNTKTVSHADLVLNLQQPFLHDLTPDDAFFMSCLELAIPEDNRPNEVTLRIVSKEEIRALNNQYRQKNKPTNVLSFPFESPPGLTLPILGDIVLAAEVIIEEANQAKCSLLAHWAHMVIHGCLHCQGYDHETPQTAEIMEAKEIQLLQKLGFPNPYMESN